MTALQNQRQQLHKDTEAKQQRKAQVEREVREGMQHLLILNNEITEKRRTIDTIRHDIGSIEGAIRLLTQQMDTLSKELEERKQRFQKSLRYLHRNRSIQNQLMFIFSADNFNQMYRRLRFTREYATFQRAQGEAVKQKKEQLEQKRRELANAQKKKRNLLSRGQQEQQQLEGKQNEQEAQVKTLQREQQTLTTLIAQQQKKERELDQRIEQLIAEEVARQKARAEAEARRRAEAARKAREAERAKKQREQEEARKSSAQKGKAADKGSATTERKKRRDTDRSTAERKRVTTTTSDNDYIEPDPDRQLSGNFESNRGRLPMPITGAYKIVRNFGRYSVEGLRGVQLESKGIHLKGQPGAHARCVFDGQVSFVSMQAGQYIVMVRHGKYISVYCGLSSVSVSPGQSVSTRQVLGTIGSDGVMQFQLRNWKKLLNPMSWLGR